MKKIRLGDACDILNGFAFKSENYVDSGIRVIRIANVQKGYIEDNTPVFYPLETNELDKYMLEEGDLLMALTGNVGRVAILKKEFMPAALNQRVACLRLKTDRVAKDYLFHVLNSAFFEQQCIQSSKGVAQKNMSTEWLKDYEIPMYPKEQQELIADILDKTRNIIISRNYELKKLDDLIKARFVEMFGDAYLNEFGWKKIKIKNAVTVEPQNGMYKPQSDYVTDGSGIPILRIDGFYDGVVTDFSSLKRLRCSENERQKYLLYEDDVVINRVNSIEYLGKCAHINGLLEDTVYESNMMRMHFDSTRFHPAYVCRLLCSRFVYDQIVNHAKQAVNQASINQKDVLDFDIYEPPLKLQIQFADFVRAVDKSKVAIQKALDKTQMLFDSLMQEYFG